MAGKKIIITESMAKEIVMEEILNEMDTASLLKSSEFKDAVAKALKDNRDYDRDFEKKVRKIVADAVVSLFKGMWERTGFWTNLISK